MCIETWTDFPSLSTRSSSSETSLRPRLSKFNTEFLYVDLSFVLDARLSGWGPVSSMCDLGHFRRVSSYLGHFHSDSDDRECSKMSQTFANRSSSLFILARDSLQQSELPPRPAQLKVPRPLTRPRPRRENSTELSKVDAGEPASNANVSSSPSSSTTASPATTSNCLRKGLEQISQIKAPLSLSRGALERRRKTGRGWS